MHQRDPVSSDQIHGNGDTAPGSVQQSADLTEGEVVAGRYKVVSLIGRGAVGAVYLVEQIFLRKEYALKTLLPFISPDVNLRRFQNEAQAASKLDHPNLVQAVDFGMIDEKRPFLVMEYVKGETLEHYFKRKDGRLPVDEALTLFIPLCFGMAYAHQQGVLHRDIKPANIVLVTDETDSPRPKIIDFGIAKLLEVEGQDLTKTGEIFGTPLYMSPEQCSGGKLDERTDIYSLGCVFYEALTGEPPFRGNTALETMMKHINDRALSLKEASLGEDFPQALETIVQTMLAKRIEQRYANFLLAAKAMAKLKGLPHAEEPVAVAEKLEEVQAKAKKYSHRYASFLAVGGIVLVLLCVLATLIPHPPPPAVVQSQSEVPKHFRFNIYENGGSNATGRIAGATTESDDTAQNQASVPIRMIVESQIIGTGSRAMKRFNFGQANMGMIWSNKSVNRLDVPSDGKVRNAEGIVSFPLSDLICFNPTCDTYGRDLAILRKFRPNDIQGLWLKPEQPTILALPEAVPTSVLIDDALYLANEIKGLRYINIAGECSPEGLRNLDKMPNLELLTIRGAHNIIPSKHSCTGADLAALQLATLKRIHGLRLSDMPGAMATLDQLSLPPKFIWLELEGCGLTDNDVATIARHLTNLTALSLARNEDITDAGAAALARMKKLKRLTLKGTKITAKSLPVLVQLTGLRVLTLDLKDWPMRAQVQLKKSLPHCLLQDGSTRHSNPLEIDQF